MAYDISFLTAELLSMRAIFEQVRDLRKAKWILWPDSSVYLFNGIDC